MHKYPARLKKDDNGTVLVMFPDEPEAITFGEDEDDALQRASEALEAALSIYVEKRLDIPAPCRPKGKKAHLVGVPALTEAKLALYTAMRASGVRKAELARRLGWPKSQVDGLLDLNHASRLEQVEQALGALGKALVLEVRDEA